MAAPTVATTNTSTELSEVTTHTVDLPSGIIAGDMLLIFVTMTNSAFPNSIPTDFTTLAPPGVMNNSDGRMRIYYKRATGSEGATVTFTTNVNSESAHVTYRIMGAAIPVGVIHSSGTGTAPDPPALTPATGSDDYLWFASCASGESAAVVTVSPTNYANLLAVDTGASPGNVCIGTARRTLAAGTDDPDAFTTTVSATWVASLIALGPEVLRSPRDRYTVIQQVAVSRASII